MSIFGLPRMMHVVYTCLVCVCVCVCVCACACACAYVCLCLCAEMMVLHA